MFSKFASIIVILAAFCRQFVVDAFAPTSLVSSERSSTIKYRDSSLYVSDIDMLEVESARKLFYLWFFGGSGGGGVALAAFPAMYDRFSDMRSLKDEGPSSDDDTYIGLSPLCLFPRDLKYQDVKKILDNKMSVETMVEKGPKDSFWAERGYLRYPAFAAANPNCNPLTLRAIFDSMTTSTSTVEPDVAQELLDAYREDDDPMFGKFKQTLLLTKAKGYFAIGVLLFLLGLVVQVSAGALADGWFPEWPGKDNFPMSIIDPGLLSIKDYWI